ncbi:MAG: VOC family protein [Actinomycetota bacterium]|nr:VOC family protein [Actinomycetota bacterium]
MANFTGVGPALPAKDIERAKSWYADKLGLKPNEESVEGLTYEIGESKFLLYPSQFAGTNQATAATFFVDDAEAVMEELRANGVTFEEYDLPGVKTEGGMMTSETAKGGWFKDTEDNILALLQRLQ